MVIDKATMQRGHEEDAAQLASIQQELMKVLMVQVHGQFNLQVDPAEEDIWGATAYLYRNNMYWVTVYVDYEYGRVVFEGQETQTKSLRIYVARAAEKFAHVIDVNTIAQFQEAFLKWAMSGMPRC